MSGKVIDASACESFRPGSLACRDDEALENALRSIILDPKLHGQEGKRGELLLTASEAQRINAALKELSPFVFCPASAPADACGSDVAPEIRARPASDDLENGAGRHRNTASASLEGHRSKKRAFTAAIDGKPSQTSTRMTKTHSRGGSSRSSAVAKPVATDKLRRVSESHKAKSGSTVSPNTTNVKTRILRRRHVTYTGSWTDACFEVTSILEKQSAARWFLTPVDPASVADYLEKISCPMDLQTVKQKLQHDMYSHPFRWQEDIRTIFYNAFTYHTAKSVIRSDALTLASLFEQLCKEYPGVNPYGICTNVKQQSSQPGSPPPPHHDPARSRPHDPVAAKEKEEDRIVLNPEELRELLARAATAAAKTPQELGLRLSLNESETQPVSASSHDSRDAQMTPFERKTAVFRGLPAQTMPSPPSPPVGTMRAGEKGPGTVHRRLVATQLRQLDVHLRLAALNLLKDELGVDTEQAACDPHFVIDFELLPCIKQKQLITYLRTLEAFQRKMIEEGYKPTLATDLQHQSKAQSDADRLQDRDFGTASSPLFDPRLGSQGKGFPAHEPGLKDDFHLDNADPEPSNNDSYSKGSSSFSQTSSYSSSSSVSSPRELETQTRDSLLVPQHESETPNSSHLSPTSPAAASSAATSLLRSQSPPETASFMQAGPGLLYSKLPYPDSQGQLDVISDSAFFCKENSVGPINSSCSPPYKVSGGKSAMPMFGLNETLFGSDLDDDKDELTLSQQDASLNTTSSKCTETLPSSWGEWKQKVLQYKVQCQMGDERNKEILSTAHSERERDAESADAEI